MGDAVAACAKGRAESDETVAGKKLFGLQQVPAPRCLRTIVKAGINGDFMMGACYSQAGVSTMGRKTNSLEES